MAAWIHFFNFGAASAGLMAALLGLSLAITATHVARWDRCLELLFGTNAKYY